jgi:nitroimidazol reductase NimA-like FMN-containing flavoprotein (pyridoxamine 5'-phosphate oxidase superfamily)
MSGMRRKEKEIAEKAVVEELLRETEVGRLATCIGEEPYVVPVNFAYYDGRIIVHGSREGRKMANIVANPRVCFEVDQSEKVEGERPCDYAFRYMSVVVQGRARVVEGDEARLAALRRLTDKYAPGKGRMLTMEDLKKYVNLAVVEVTVDSMTGKRSPAPSRP